MLSRVSNLMVLLMIFRHSNDGKADTELQVLKFQYFLWMLGRAKKSQLLVSHVITMVSKEFFPGAILLN